MMDDLRAQILNADDVQREQVEVPEWGCTVEVRGMTGAQRANYLQACVDENGKPRFDRIYPEILIACTHFPADHVKAGEQIFEPTDREILNTKSAAATERIAKVAMRLSGIDDGGIPGEKAAEAAKNA